MSTYRYPYRWGILPVQSFVEKYARGTYILAKILDMSPGELRHRLVEAICMGRSIQFECIKRVIKQLDWDGADEVLHLKPPDQKVLYKRLLWDATNDVLDEKRSLGILDSARRYLYSLEGHE